MSMTRNQNHDHASSTKMIKTCDNGSVAPWSDLTHDVLLLVMMKLGLVDFLAFNKVCKSWRSLALLNKNKLIVSRPPMSMHIYSDTIEKHYELEDFEGRKLKINLPHSADRRCSGLTCGYLIFFGEKTNDFWLLNPITRHGHHFPDVTFSVSDYHDDVLVFSPSISGWVFVVYSRIYRYKIWFSIAGKREWTEVYTPFHVRDLHAFKGKIYTVDSDSRLYEVRLYPTPKVTLLEINNFRKPGLIWPRFLSSVENLYVIDRSTYKIQEMNFSKMEWVPHNMMGEEYGYFISDLDYGVAVFIDKSRYAFPVTNRNMRVFYANIWYFFHDCLNVNLLHE